jgi:hypothetical protein
MVKPPRLSGTPPAEGSYMYSPLEGARLGRGGFQLFKMKFSFENGRHNPDSIGNPFISTVDKIATNSRIIKKH